MTSSNGVGDGSWNLTIHVSDLNIDKTLRVRGDLHIGGLMLQLVNVLGVSNDWSDFALWWPTKTIWLLRTRSTLDQYGVQADALLHFTPMHKTLRVLLPDLQVVDLRVNFSTNVFSVVIKICKELGIRHPEELSLARLLSPEELKRNQGVSATRRSRPSGLRSPSTMDSPQYSSNVSLMYSNATPGSTLQIHSPGRYTPNRTASRGSLLRTSSVALSPYGTTLRSPYALSYNANGTMTPGSVNSLFFASCSNGPDSPLANSPQLTTAEAFDLLYRPRGAVEKARTNAGWFDSSRSLMEQGIVENNLVLLKYKFYAFYDLTPKHDAVRINQIYEQAKWSLISEELDCTLEEMIVFAALQVVNLFHPETNNLQVQVQSQLPQHPFDNSHNYSVNEVDEDNVDAALDELQRALEGCTTSDVTVTSPAVTKNNNHNNRPCSDLTDVPQLADYLRYLKPKKGLWWRSYKKCYFVFRDTCLSMYRTSKAACQSPEWTINLRGCEVCPDVTVATSRYNMKLFVTSSDALVELWLRTDTADQYIRWMAAMRLACNDHTMADSCAYESEVKAISSLLGMQQSATIRSAPVTLSSTVNQFNVEPQNFIAPKYLRKHRPKQLIQRILEAHKSVCDMGLIDAKLNYIKTWQSLKDFGISYFIVRFKQLKKEELLGVAHNRLIRYDLHSGDILRTWHFPHMKSWSVNWDLKQVLVSFEEEDLVFQCFTADCKVVHEYIGGYIFLSMRSGDRSQTLNEELFHKLTGGWL